MNTNSKFSSLRHITSSWGSIAQQFLLFFPPAGGVGNAFPVGETTFLYLTNPCSIVTCHIQLPPPQAFCSSFLSTSLGIKYSMANPAFFFLSGTQGGNIFRFFMCPDQKGQFFIIPQEVKQSARDIFRHSRKGTGDLETHTTSVSGHLERVLNYNS